MVTKTNKNVCLIVVGVFVGVVNGFFGGGGGMICVSALLLIGLTNKKAQATTILIMLPISIASGIVYYTSGFVRWEIIIYTAIGSILGGVIGALLLKKLSNNVVKYIFAMVVIAAGIKMFI